MAVLNANQITKSFGNQTVLDEISLTINEGERVGIVGPNGCGKTTLMRCLAGEMPPDSGSVSIASGVSIGYLEQLPEAPPHLSAWDLVMEGFADLIAKRRELKELEREMALPGAYLEAVMARYARVLEEYEEGGGYACETNARRILSGLGFRPEQFEQPFSSFSGGEKTRLNLARLLAINPDLILLDEPTNHLDMEAMEWLEAFLAGYRGTLVVVSHDRRFLDQVATRIVELRQGKVRSYPGNYSRYLALREEEELARWRAYEKQQEKVKKTEEFIRRYGAGIKARQARGRKKQLERMALLDKPERRRSMLLTVNASGHLGGEVALEAKNIRKSFGGKEVLSDVSFTIRRGERVALLGANGAGKSTLLNIVAGRLEADSGEIRRGEKVRLGYLTQQNEELALDKTVLECLLDGTDMTPGEARTLLGRMCFFGDDVFKTVGSLSGGERMRLKLLKLFSAPLNFIVLDEPTNHLDIESREVVEEAINEFEGTVLLVSHDRFLLDRTAERVMVLEEGKLAFYDGNYSFYREQVAQRADVEKVKARGEQRIREDLERERQKEKETEVKRLKERMGALEAEMEALEKRKGELEDMLSDPARYAGGEEARLLTAEYREICDSLEQAYQEWAALVDQI